MQPKKTLYQVDNFRMIAALLVVAIHVSPLQKISVEADFILTRVVARVGVPFFFMVSGYFLLAPCFLTGKDKASIERENRGKTRINSKLKKLIIIYLGAILLYLPLNLYTGYFVGDFTVSKVLKDILVNGTFYHLWYLPAAIFGLLFLYHLSRRYSIKQILYLSGILYLIGLCGDSYYGVISKLPFLQRTYEIMFQCFDYTRNGLFFAPIFMMLGVVIAKRGGNRREGENGEEIENDIEIKNGKEIENDNEIKNGKEIGNKKEKENSKNREINQEKKYHTEQDNSRRRGITTCLIVSLSLMTLEAYCLKTMGYQRHDSMYLMLVPVMYYLYLLLVKCSQKQRKTLFPRELSLLIYILHPYVIVLIRGFAKVIQLQKLLVEDQFILYLLTCSISVAVAYFAIFIWKKINVLIRYDR